MTHSRNKEDVILFTSLSICFPVIVFASLLIERDEWGGERYSDRNVELKTHCQVNQIMLRAHQCMLCGYIHITCDLTAIRLNCHTFWK